MDRLGCSWEHFEAMVGQHMVIYQRFSMAFDRWAICIFEGYESRINNGETDMAFVHVNNMSRLPNSLILHVAYTVSAAITASTNRSIPSHASITWCIYSNSRY